MKLADWLKENRHKRYVFAGRIGVTGSMITAYCEGRSMPGRNTLESIVRETAGAVTANDFLSAEAAATIAEGAEWS